MVHLMPLHTKTPPCLASFKSRLVLLFWYQLTQVVLEERPLNGCVCVFTRLLKQTQRDMQTRWLHIPPGRKVITIVVHSMKNEIIKLQVSIIHNQKCTGILLTASISVL